MNSIHFRPFSGLSPASKRLRVEATVISAGLIGLHMTLPPTAPAPLRPESGSP
jgi:hypothetical protein